MARLYDEFLPKHHLIARGSFHEIHLSDPKRVIRTVLRQPVAPVAEGR